ncbi:MAG: hypothetical protein LC754_14095 [Acidobacteria bacterium]|nr:hypothetical protein [Acidobacteriota bacterium]
MAAGIIRKILSEFYEPVRSRLAGISAQLDRNAVLLGQLMSYHVSRAAAVERLTEAEFKVFSQCGEDGIIQYLISKVPIEKRVFVEFGVGDYSESNTRFLLVNNKWSGLVIEGSAECVSNIKRSEMYRRHQLIVIAAFITAENINQIIKDAGIEEDIGLLSIDVDGNDYWVWQAINIVRPRIVICEFHSRFGYLDAVTVPYKPDFQVARAHPSRLFYGASLPALCLLAGQKGYDFVGCTSEGVNAFFVRQDLSATLSKMDARDGFETIVGGGGHYGLSARDEIKAIEHMEVYDLITESLRPLRDVRVPHD